MSDLILAMEAGGGVGRALLYLGWEGVCPRSSDESLWNQFLPWCHLAGFCRGLYMRLGKDKLQLSHRPLTEEKSRFSS